MSGPSYPPPSHPPAPFGQPGQPGPPPRRSRGRRVLLALVALVTACAIFGASFGVTTLVMGSDDDDGRADRDRPSSSAPTSDAPTSDAPTTSPTGSPTEPSDDAWSTEGPAVQDAAGEFVRVVNTYGPGGLDADGRLPDYRASVEELVTPELDAEFLQGVPLAEKRAVTDRAGSTAEVDGTGVARLSDETAQVLVAATVAQTRTSRGGAVSRVGTPTAARVRVDLVRTDGDWRVSGFTSVTAGRGGSPGSTGRDPDVVPSAGRDAEVRAREALEAVVSYDYRTLDRDLERATSFLTYSYGQTFGREFAAIRREARRVRAVTRSEAVSSGVTSVDGDEATVLLYSDQTSRTRAGRQSFEARVLVRMRLVDGEWLLDDLSTL